MKSDGNMQKGSGKQGLSALELAKSHTIDKSRNIAFRLPAKLRKYRILMQSAYEYFRSDGKKHIHAAEWVLDNYYVVQQAIRQVHNDMPGRYYKQLPVLESPLNRGPTRVFSIAWEITRNCENQLDQANIIRFVRSYQKIEPLTMGELWAIPTMLRLGVLESLSCIISHISGLPYESIYSNRVIEEISDEDTLVANCILSLRMLAVQDWKEFFEKVSTVEDTFRHDPACIYSDLDFNTRDSYRKIVEIIASDSGLDELEIAQEAIKLAGEPGDDTRSIHVGFFLLTREGRDLLETSLGYSPAVWRSFRRFLSSHVSALYAGGIVTVFLFFLLCMMWYALTSGAGSLQMVIVLLLSLLPASAMGVDLVNSFLMNTTTPGHLPRMDFSKGLPSEYRTMVVIPTLLGDTGDVYAMIRQIEKHFLANRDRNITFAILSDFTDAPKQHMPGDDELLELTRKEVEKLNIKYHRYLGDLFYHFHRRREWNPSENCWMGWERKRGKLMEFNHLLRGTGGTAIDVRIGKLSILPDIKYVITLDSDTSLPQNCARKLVATMVHPLNKPLFDLQAGKFSHGYTVLQPRVLAKSSNVSESIFTKIFAGDFSIDLYSNAVSDVYQDLFNEGSYVGKGIYDVEAFDRCLEGRIPENALLSHDLFEGIHGRAGLVTDIVLYEEFPPNYIAWAHRLHRWIRGDWQLLPWLWPKVPDSKGDRIPNDLSFLDQWKLIDNIRRSMLGPALFILLIAGWLGLPGSPLFWTLTVLLVVFRCPLSDTLFELFRRFKRRSLLKMTGYMKAGWFRSLFTIIFLLYETSISLDAMIATILRLTITRKKLLQWRSAAHTISMFGGDLKVGLVWAQMYAVIIFIPVFCSVLILLDSPGFIFALPFFLAWLASPMVAQIISRIPVERTKLLKDEQYKSLRTLAAHTWYFFETIAGPEDHWLPPDHFQEDPLSKVAHRTSPTNIGLFLLSILAAHDRGYIGMFELSLRLSDTLAGMKQLEKYRGHLLNWYDTRTLEPLRPRYVSVVDSGNLAGCLLTLKQGCLEIQNTPFLNRKSWQGFIDILDILVDILEEESLEAAGLLENFADIRNLVTEAIDTPRTWVTLLIDLCNRMMMDIDGMLLAFVEKSSGKVESHLLKKLQIWSGRMRKHLSNTLRELEMLFPWLLHISHPPELFRTTDVPRAISDAWHFLMDSLPPCPSPERMREIATRSSQRLNSLTTLLSDEKYSSDLVKEAIEWCGELEKKIAESLKMSGNILKKFNDLVTAAETEFRGIDFGFLFNKKRKVFHIGYNVESEHLDPNFYDLLASEARLASLIAIARGDVPRSHWLHLSRPLTVTRGMMTLLSWSGTMFEYLMPMLLAGNFENTILDQSCHAAVRCQIAYGKNKGVPWGISESSYYRFDAGMHYQYKAFGVPGLGFKRGLEEELVVAPYASILALPIAPVEVLANMKDLKDHDLLGRYGFYESIDFTESRLPAGKESAVIHSYMAHHQGMILLSIGNFLDHNCMVRRFRAEPLIQIVDLLLQERISSGVPVEPPRPEISEVIRPLKQGVVLEPWMIPTDFPVPQVYYLSNGSYSVLITEAGSGFSRWKETDITRWRADTSLDCWGTWIYVKDCDTGNYWSLGAQPTVAFPDASEIRFFPHKVEFHRRDNDISSRMEILVAPEDDAEIRRIDLKNNSDRKRKLLVCSYAEIVLTQQSVDLRHPSFNKLFIESEYITEENALLFHHRPRSKEEKEIYVAHLVTGPDGDTSFETNRESFLGRGGNARNPRAFCRQKTAFTRTTGTTLDPVMVACMEIELVPHGEAQIFFVTIAAPDRAAVCYLAKQFKTPAVINSTFERAGFFCKREMARQKLTSVEIKQIQILLSSLVYPGPSLRAGSDILGNNILGQQDLWKFGISGDYPVLLVSVNREDNTTLVNELLRAHSFWRNRGLKIDLVILNMKETGYEQDLQKQLQHLISSTGGEKWTNTRGGIFLLRADQMEEKDRILLKTVARTVLDCNRGTLDIQLGSLTKEPVRLPGFVSTMLPDKGEKTPLLERPENLLFDNGIGGFSADGREYVIYLDENVWTPSPWINVIANSSFGFTASETGLGCTWALNSGENRLTPWRNDPVSDTPGEAIYLRDEETGIFWSPTPLPVREKEPYLIRHGAGYTSWEHNSNGLNQKLIIFAFPNDPLKAVNLYLTNNWDRNRRITATFYLEPVMGTTRSEMQQYIIPEFNAAGNALLARNTYNTEFKGKVLFLAASRVPNGLTTDRTEFLGRRGNYSSPAALSRVGLSGTVESGLDPCLAIQIMIWIGPGEEKDLTFLIGQGENRENALQIIQKNMNRAKEGAIRNEVAAFWDGLLGCVEVETPDAGMNLMLNRWLLYQTLSCRIWGRTALYQSSGAFGFRDQLQDIMALGNAAPEIFRDHILMSASRQFREGDVLHWWHPPRSRGVRTRCSDDLLWLPYTTAIYIENTGDQSILTEKVSFLEGSSLEDEEEERYASYSESKEKASLYKHCLLALEKGSTKGSHGLPLMGSHDWNDGMNRVGTEGSGESVWLGWFLYSTLKTFVPVCKLMKDKTKADEFLNRAEELRKSLRENAWDGNWYLRAFYDDGFALGSSENVECQIDSIAQSWAVLSGAGEPGRVEKAMSYVSKMLVDNENKLILLFTPPFDKTERDPGYIKSYLPGIRENGGQYTHAAVWVAWAFAELGRGNIAEALFHLINPVYHSDTPLKIDKYRVEPYSVAADVYSIPSHKGRGGWTWYTGAAGWLYRFGIEGILGINRRGSSLIINPCIPERWSEFSVNLRYGSSVYHILVKNPEGVCRGVSRIEMDEKTFSDGKIPLKDDRKEHEIQVIMGRENTTDG